MQSKATTVEDYISELDSDRQESIAAVRKIILKNIDPAFQEQMQYGMIGYSVPHSIYPPGYHCDPKQPLPFAALASQKNYMSLYLISAYNDTEFDSWIRDAFEKLGKKLDMGKCCIRFKKLSDLPLDVVAEAFRRVRCDQFVKSYELFLSEHRATKSSTKKATKVATKEVSKTKSKTTAIKSAAPAKKTTKGAKSSTKSSTKSAPLKKSAKGTKNLQPKPTTKSTKKKAAKKRPAK